MIFTHEHDEIKKTTKRFVEDVINPNIEEWERDGMFPAHEVMKAAGDLGLLGITKPESVGGMALDYSYEVAFAEGLGHARHGGVPMAIGVQTDMATPALARFGSKELQEEFLAPAVAGEQVACIGVSEPGAGSDVANITTHARKDGDDYIINGAKMWITNGTQADWCCMLVNTNPDEKRHTNKSLIVVPLDAKGVNRETKLDKLGMRASDTAMIFLDEVRVPQRNLIGQEGAGFTYQMMQFQEERLYLTASVIEGLQDCINETIDYTRQRKIFNSTVLDQQYVHYRLAELKTEVEAVRSMIYRATADYVNGKDVVELASMAKLKIGRLCREVTDTCIQFWGGQGFMQENLCAQQYRDMRLVSIGGGADEVMLSIICKYMGTMPKPQK